MNEKDLPTQLETLEDYKKASLAFVLPFLQNRAVRIADTLRDLYRKVEAGEALEREDVDYFLNQFREATQFAEEGNPTNLYFKNVLELEKRLAEAGEFTVEEIVL
jgi:hypothetical protein